MKLLPFAVIYGGGLTAQAVLSSLNTIHTGNVADINLQIAELNANYALYGFGSSPNLPNLPAIPTPGSTAPQGIAYFQSAQSGKDTGPSSSFLLIDAYTSNGYADPSSPLDSILTDTVLAALISARRALAPYITTQPADQSVAHIAANIAVVASGTGLTYQWQRSALGTGAWTNLTNTGVFTGATTATLALSATTVIANNGDKYRCLITSTNGGGSVMTRVMVLTVT